MLKDKLLEVTVWIFKILLLLVAKALQIHIQVVAQLRLLASKLVQSAFLEPIVVLGDDLLGKRRNCGVLLREAFLEQSLLDFLVVFALGDDGAFEDVPLTFVPLFVLGLVLLVATALLRDGVAFVYFGHILWSGFLTG